MSGNIGSHTLKKILNRKHGRFLLCDPRPSCLGVVFRSSIFRPIRKIVAQTKIMNTKVALFNFARHGNDWLEQISNIAKDEPWGNSLKPLELYIRANFEIAKQQGKVYEDESKGIAVWRPGFLVNKVSDPIWLVYKVNPHKNRGKQPWMFERVHTGRCPVQISEELSISYSPPEFKPDWNIYISQKAIEHIMTHNQDRLKKVFGPLSNNEHLVFRVIYAEIHLKKKESNVIPQWYRGEYQFLMPLNLTNAGSVELTATLEPNPATKQYDVRTLLYPHYAYAHARAVVKSYSSFVDWLKLGEGDLSDEIVDDED